MKKHIGTCILGIAFLAGCAGEATGDEHRSTRSRTALEGEEGAGKTTADTGEPKADADTGIPHPNGDTGAPNPNGDTGSGGRGDEGKGGAGEG